MNSRTRAPLAGAMSLVCAALMSSAACHLEDPALAGDGVASSAAPILFGADSDGSSLKWNGMHWNGMHWNGMHWNGMHWNGVPWEDLTPEQQLWHEIRTDSLPGAPLSDAGDDPDFTQAITDPAVRYLFEYIVSCALPGGAAVSYVDANGDAWTFPGLHGMAPQWESEESCDTSCQRWVSSCLYARVNYYGERNVLSWRSGANIAGNPHVAGMEDPSADEDQAFELEEGAVWGNLFLETPEMWVCRGVDTIANLSLLGLDLVTLYAGEVPMGAIRMCAADQDCLQNVYAGPCFGQDRVCDGKRTDNDAYHGCAGPGGSTYDEVITIRRADFGFHADFVPGAGLDPQLSSCATTAAGSSTCDQAWDADCIDDYALAAKKHGGCNASSLLLLSHSPLTTGLPLTRNGSTCTAYVCALDGSCCDTLLGWWDGTCAAMAADLCQ